MKCLVTGATGFVGRTLSDSLVAAGHTVSLTSRHGGRTANGVPVSALDLTDGNLAQLVEGIDTIFHLAGLAHQSADAADYQRVNVDVPLALAEAALAAGCKTFIFVSSTRADHGDDPSADHYSQSKRRAETALRSLVSGNAAMSVQVVRPSLVYGVGVKGNLALLASAVRRGLPLPPALGERSMISVQDLCSLLMRLSELPPRASDVLTVTDGEQYSTRRIVTAMRTGMGRTGRGLMLPLWCWRLAARMLDWRNSASAGFYFNKLFGDDVAESDAAQHVGGWAPRQVFEDLAAEIMTAAGPGQETAA